MRIVFGVIEPDVVVRYLAGSHGNGRGPSCVGLHAAGTWACTGTCGSRTNSCGSAGCTDSTGPPQPDPHPPAARTARSRRPAAATRSRSCRAGWCNGSSWRRRWCTSRTSWCSTSPSPDSIRNAVEFLSGVVLEHASGGPPRGPVESPARSRRGRVRRDPSCSTTGALGALWAPCGPTSRPRARTATSRVDTGVACGLARGDTRRRHRAPRLRGAGSAWTWASTPWPCLTGAGPGADPRLRRGGADVVRAVPRRGRRRRRAGARDGRVELVTARRVLAGPWSSGARSARPCAGRRCGSPRPSPLVATTALMVVPSLVGSDDGRTVMVAGAPQPALTRGVRAGGAAVGLDVTIERVTSESACGRAVRSSRTDLALLLDSPAGGRGPSGGHSRPGRRGRATGARVCKHATNRLRSEGVDRSGVAAALSPPEVRLDVVESHRDCPGSPSRRSCRSVSISSILDHLRRGERRRDREGEPRERGAARHGASTRPAPRQGDRCRRGRVDPVRRRCRARARPAGEWRVALPPDTATVLASSAVFFVVGAAVYLLAAAALGALVDRPEEVGSASGLGVLLIGSYPDSATATDKPAHPCPCCGGRMSIIETFKPGSTPQYRPPPPTAIRIDTS